MIYSNKQDIKSVQIERKKFKTEIRFGITHLIIEGAIYIKANVLNFIEWVSQIEWEMNYVFFFNLNIYI